VPTYQYACKDCGHTLEQFQSFSDDALSVCPVCEGRLRKVFNAVGVVFKGSGFYRNDSRTDGGKPGNGNGTGTEAPAAKGSSDGASSDSSSSKPATTSSTPATSSSTPSTPSTSSTSSSGASGKGSTSAA
jgi:putative FmdB family regulatory protein